MYNDSQNRPLEAFVTNLGFEGYNTTSHTTLPEAISSANKALDTESHCNILDGHSAYCSGSRTGAMLSYEEAVKALNLGIRIGNISTTQDYHGSHKGEYSFSPIYKQEHLESAKNPTSVWESRLLKNLSIDPAYGYSHIGSRALSLASLKSYIQSELQKDAMRSTDKTTAPKLSMAERMADATIKAERRNKLAAQEKQQPQKQEEAQLCF